MAWILWSLKEHEVRPVLRQRSPKTTWIRIPGHLLNKLQMPRPHPQLSKSEFLWMESENSIKRKFPGKFLHPLAFEGHLARRF